MFEEAQPVVSPRERVQQLWAAARRRRWYIILPVFLGFVVANVVSWVLPARYRSEAAILVEQQKVPEELVTPNVVSDVQARLQSMQQEILSRTRLLRIMDELHLFPDDRGRLTPERAVDYMRKQIDIDQVQTPGRRDVTAFKVRFSYTDPRTAQQVTDQLTRLFIDENLRSRQQQSENTTGFLETELEEARKNLAEQEARVRDFKARYLGQLPGQLQPNLEILSGLQGRLAAEVDALNRAKQQNLYLKSMLGQYRALRTELRRSGTPGDSQGLDKELARMRSELANLSAKYTDQYPEVRKLKQEIARTEAMKKQAEAEAQSMPKPDPATETVAAVTSAAEVRDLSPMLEVESQLRANEMEIENRQREMKRLNAQIDQYQGRLNQTPVREQQLADLTRDYEQSRKNYESLLAKKNQSELATNLEKRQQGENFRLLDPASLPQRPYFPNRLLFSILGLFAGAVLGGGIALALEATDDRVYSESDLARLVPARVLATVPVLPTTAEQQLARRRLWMELSAGGALALVVMAGFLLTYLRG